MPVMGIREMRMAMDQIFVSMPMGMGLARRVLRSMCVLMMLVVDV
jgi:hypothetical protein